MERISLGKMQNPVRGLLHGSAALVSVVGVIALIASADGPGFVSVAIIYGIALVGVFTTSTLYHCLPWSIVWKARFQRLDHTWIYALVAATFTALLVGLGRRSAGGRSGSPSSGESALSGPSRSIWPRTRNRWTLLTQIASRSGLMAPLYLMLGGMEPRLFRLTVVGQHRLSRRHADDDSSLAPPSAPHLFVSRGVPHHRDRRRHHPLPRRQGVDLDGLLASSCGFRAGS